MRFGPVPLTEAEGAVLAHSVALAKGRLRKGLVLRAADLERLRAAGVTQVTVARLEPGDVAEDAAAARLARALVPEAEAAGLRLGDAATGRVNIHARQAGIVGLDVAAIHALNRVDPMITLATVPPWQRMAAGGMVATVKIISYAVPETALEAACAAGHAALRLCRPQVTRAALVQTAVGGQTLKGHAALAGRLDRLGVDLAPEVVVPHDVDALARALGAASGEVIFVLTASATSDLHDVAPAALRQAGGEVLHFGMPVDPGNLLFLGRLGPRPVIGLPGCARSPALNGADWVLERVICGVPVSPGDIARMGVGGLLKEIPLRGRLREG